MRQDGTFPVGNTTLRYIIDGEGTPTLVIGSALYYDRVFSKQIRRHLRFGFIDHRGFAAPDPTLDVSAVTLQSLAEDIETARLHLGWERFVLIGHSGHAFMALEYAKRFPDHVSHLVLMNVSPDYHTRSHEVRAKHFEANAEPERQQAFYQNMSVIQERIEADPEHAFAIFNVLSGPQGWYDFRFDATEFWADVPTNMPLIDHIWGGLFHDIDITEGINHLTAPVLLILGRHDYVVPPAHLWDEVWNKFSDLTMVTFERSAHAPMFEEPELFDTTLLEWLASR